MGKRTVNIINHFVLKTPDGQYINKKSSVSNIGFTTDIYNARIFNDMASAGSLRDKIKEWNTKYGNIFGNIPEDVRIIGIKITEEGEV